MAAIKTAVSLDEKLFRQANKMAKRMRISRSRLMSLALRELLEHERSREIIEKLNEVYAGGLSEEDQMFLKASSRHMAKLARDDPW